MYLIQYLIIISTFSFCSNIDHLLLIRIVTQPDKAESISILNPTENAISLKDYYISDDEDYYKMHTDNDPSPSSSSGFTAKFPEVTINPGDTMHIVLNEDYNEFYGTDFAPDITMFQSSFNSMQETESGSFGISSNKLDDDSELIILFKWNGSNLSLIEDVDYFLWGAYQTPINKTGIDNYKNDTSNDSQLYFEIKAEENYAYTRFSTQENSEIKFDGNGITGNNETSENFRESWHLSAMFNLGCTDSNAPNFSELAEKDDGSCYIPFLDILNGTYDCGNDSRDACQEDGKPSPNNCKLVNIEGKIVSFGDYSDRNGPYALVLEDEEGYRIESTIWPATWDILNDNNFSILTEPPYYDFVITAYGHIYEYNGKKQIYTCGPSTIDITQTYNIYGIHSPRDTSITSINPEPFVLIPSLGENLNYSYTFPNNSRVIIRIFDLSGRFITSLEDKFFEYGGTVFKNNYNTNEFGHSINTSAWNGKDQLGQILSPGTYIMNLEVMNPLTGKRTSDSAPIVIGTNN